MDFFSIENLTVRVFKTVREFKAYCSSAMEDGTIMRTGF